VYTTSVLERASAGAKTPDSLRSASPYFETQREQPRQPVGLPEVQSTDAFGVASLRQPNHTQTAEPDRASPLRLCQAMNSHCSFMEEASMILTVRRTCEAVCGGVLAVALCAGPAFAQDPAPATPPAQPQQPTLTAPEPETEGFTLTPFLGGGFGGSLESGSVSFGLGVGYGVSERVTLEGELGILPSGTMGVPTEFDTSAWSLNANVLYHFTAQEHFTPYATAGIGVLSANPDLSDDVFDDVSATDASDDTSFSWNLGAGLKSAFNDRLGIRGDLRYFNASGLAPDFWRLYAGLTVRGFLD